jgi:mono/diheme cytochrome c family protein
VALVVAVAGCGRVGRSSDATALRHGRGIFARSCAGCHTLAGRESGAVGGDLVNAHLSVADLASFAKVMPTAARLSSADVLAVAEYVHSVAASAGRQGR